MNINRLFLSCAVVSITCGSVIGASQVKAQGADDFMAPPVIENVKEITIPSAADSASNDAEIDLSIDVLDIEGPEGNDMADMPPVAPEIQAPEIATEPVEMAAPDVGFPDVDEASFAPVPVASEPVADMQVPDFPEMPPEISIPSPAPVANISEPKEDAQAVAGAVEVAPAPVVNIPVPTQPKVTAAPVDKTVVAKISGESKGGVEASSSYDLEEKYYSSDRGVTTSDLDVPQKADPIKDPAQKLIIVDRVGVQGGVDSRFVAAQRALDLRRFSSALHMFEELYEKNPRDQRILMGRAVALQMTGHEEKAIQAYEDLLDLTPKNPKVLVNLLGLVSKQYPAVALERLKGLYEKNPGNASIAAQMGLAEAELHNYDSAERFIGIATSLEPDNAKHYYNLAVVYDRNREYKKAVTQYERALEIDSMYRAGDIKRDVVYDRLARLRNM